MYFWSQQLSISYLKKIALVYQFLFVINNPVYGYLLQRGALCKWLYESCSEHSSSSLWLGMIVGGLWGSFMLFRGSLSSVIKGRLILDHVEHLRPFRCSAACTSPVYPPDPSPLNPCLNVVVVHPPKESHSVGRLAERTPLRQQWAGVKACLLPYSRASPLLQPVTD